MTGASPRATSTRSAPSAPGCGKCFTAADEQEAAASLNAVLEDVSATPRVSVHGEGPHLHFEPEGGSPARWLGAVGAMGLTTALIEGGFKRFGRCASTTCDDVFVDTSRNRSPPPLL